MCWKKPPTPTAATCANRSAPLATSRRGGVRPCGQALWPGLRPEGWRSLASVFPAYDDPLLEESGLVIVNEEDGGKRYDRFRDRVMFPIRNVKGECIGFGGRVLGDENPGTSTHPKPRSSTKAASCMGLFEARTPSARRAMRW